MVRRMDVVAWAAVMALAGASVARASDNTVGTVPTGASSSSPYALTLDNTTAAPAPDTAVTPAPETAAPAAAAPQYTPLMSLLNRIPAGGNHTVASDMAKWGLSLGGYVEGGYTANFDHHASSTFAAGPYTYKNPENFGRVFDQEVGNHVDLNQVDLNLTKTIDFTSKDFRNSGFAFGGTIEWLYGTDAALVHSDGLNFYHSASYPATDPSRPQEQFDLEQAYVDLAMPLGDTAALRVRVGKFDTLLGYETINPTTNPFYSHTYMFGYAIPFTNTGVMANLILNPQLQFWGGVVRGWDVATKDNNSAVSFMGSVQYTPTTYQSISLNVISGPEDTNDDAHYRSVFDLVASVTPQNMFDKKMTFGVNADYGYDGAGGGYTGPTGVQGVHSDWYGVALYASYLVNKYATFNARGEWFYDGLRDAVAGGPQTDYYEATIGLNITPFPDSHWGQNLHIRPELRGDYATKKVFINYTNRVQFTGAVDVFYTF